MARPGEASLPTVIRPRVLGAALSLLVAACTVGDAAAPSGPPPATELCAETEQLPLQRGGVLAEPARPPVPYNSTPPTSGWSSDAPIVIEVFDRPLREAQQVSVLSVGGVVVTHAPLDDADRTALHEAARSFPGRVATTPYGRLRDGQVVFAAQGVLQRCEAVDVDALAAFVEAYADQSPQTARPVPAATPGSGPSP